MALSSGGGSEDRSSGGLQASEIAPQVAARRLTPIGRIQFAQSRGGPGPASTDQPSARHARDRRALQEVGNAIIFFSLARNPIASIKRAMAWQGADAG